MAKPQVSISRWSEAEACRLLAWLYVHVCQKELGTDDCGMHCTCRLYDPCTSRAIFCGDLENFSACLLLHFDRCFGACAERVSLPAIDCNNTEAPHSSILSDTFFDPSAGMSALKTAYEAATAEAEPCQLSVVLDEACNLLGASTGLDEEGRRKVGPCCAITCLPLTLCPAVPAVQIEGGSCWVSPKL